MKIYAIVLAVVIAAVVVGCGGGGGSETSPFAGQWQGSWVDAGNAQSGTVSLTIGTDGSMSGSIHNDTLSLDGTASGSISRSGQVAGAYAYPGQTYTTSGTLIVNGAGHLVGTLQIYDSGILVGSADIDLTKT